MAMRFIAISLGEMIALNLEIGIQQVGDGEMFGPQIWIDPVGVLVILFIRLFWMYLSS